MFIKDRGVGVICGDRTITHRVGVVVGNLGYQEEDGPTVDQVPVSYVSSITSRENLTSRVTASGCRYVAITES